MIDFVERNSSVVKSLVSQYFPNPADREDALQEINIKFMYVDSSIMDNEEAWVYAAVRNLCRDIYRANARTNELDQWASIGNGVDDECPLAVLEREQEEEVIERKLEDLPPNLCETGHLYYRVGLNYNAIAAKLNIPEGTVASRMNTVRYYLSRG